MQLKSAEPVLDSKQERRTSSIIIMPIRTRISLSMLSVLFQVSQRHFVCTIDVYLSSIDQKGRNYTEQIMRTVKWLNVRDAPWTSVGDVRFILDRIHNGNWMGWSHQEYESWSKGIVRIPINGKRLKNSHRKKYNEWCSGIPGQSRFSSLLYRSRCVQGQSERWKELIVILHSSLEVHPSVVRKMQMDRSLFTTTREDLDCILLSRVRRDFSSHSKAVVNKL